MIPDPLISKSHPNLALIQPDPQVAIPMPQINDGVTPLDGEEEAEIRHVLRTHLALLLRRRGMQLGVVEGGRGKTDMHRAIQALSRRGMQLDVRDQWCIMIEGLDGRPLRLVGHHHGELDGEHLTDAIDEAIDEQDVRRLYCAFLLGGEGCGGDVTEADSQLPQLLLGDLPIRRDGILQTHHHDGEGEQVPEGGGVGGVTWLCWY